MSSISYNPQQWLRELGMEAMRKADARGMGLETVHNGAVDAFRHVYISAKMTRDKNRAIARILGTTNEIIHTNPADERFMDEYNNTVGRALGTKAELEHWNDDKLADEVKQLIDDGYVILNPSNVPKQKLKLNPYFIPESFPKDIQDIIEEPVEGNSHKTTHLVFVHPYVRQNGDVKGHNRSRPDGDVGNNLGKGMHNKQSGASSQFR